MNSLPLNVLTIVHFLSIGGLALYGIHRIWMIFCRFRHPRGNRRPAPPPPSMVVYPAVTVQLPLYNESLVARRIVDAAAAFQWPVEKLEIQVLDDSTDETQDILQERVAFWSSRGVNIRLIHRDHRAGYKAGALAQGLKTARGEFIAIFDADFVPSPDFLERILPRFTHPEIGMVQARWGFLNAGYSWLTRLQALLISAHFNIEHAVRFARGLFFNFNGTAGIWRKTAIESAGGWRSDTVTEDLDLSYRTQMAGWRFVYADDVVVPSELPVTLSDFRGQQERWAKGAIQTARKLLPSLLAAPLPLPVKIEAMAHLLANCCWVFGFLATVTLYPTLLNRVGIGVYQILWFDLPLFFLAGTAVIAFYTIHGISSRQKGILPVLALLPAASIGLAPFFSLAVIKGWLRNGGVFERTPKFGVLENTPARRFHVAVPPNIIMNLMINIPLLLYTLIPVLFAWRRETWPAIPLLCFFPLGFFIIAAHDATEAFDAVLRRHRR